MFHVVAQGTISTDQGLKGAFSSAADLSQLRDAIIKVRTERLSGLIGVLYGRYLTGAKSKVGEKVAFGMDALEQLLSLSSGSYEILSVADGSVMTELKQSLGIELPELLQLAEGYPDKSLVDVLKILPVNYNASPLAALLEDEFFGSEGVVSIAPSEAASAAQALKPVQNETELVSFSPDDLETKVAPAITTAGAESVGESLSEKASRSLTEQEAPGSREDKNHKSKTENNRSADSEQVEAAEVSGPAMPAEEKVNAAVHVAADQEKVEPAAEAAADEDRVEPAAEAAADEDRGEPAAEAAADEDRGEPAAEAAADEDRVEPAAEAAADEDLVEPAAEAAADEDLVEPAAEAAADGDRVEPAAEAAADGDRVEPAAEAAADEDLVEPAAEAAADEDRVEPAAEAAADVEAGLLWVEPPEQDVFLHERIESASPMSFEKPVYDDSAKVSEFSAAEQETLPFSGFPVVEQRTVEFSQFPIVEQALEFEEVPLVEQTAWDDAVRELEVEFGSMEIEPVSFFPEPAVADSYGADRGENHSDFADSSKGREPERNPTFVAEESFSPQMQDRVDAEGFAARPDFLPPPPPPRDMRPQLTKQEADTPIRVQQAVAPAQVPLQPEPFTQQPEPFTQQPEPFTQQPEPFTQQPEPFTQPPVETTDLSASGRILLSGPDSQAVKKWTAELARKSAAESEADAAKVDVSGLRSSQKLTAEDLPIGTDEPGGSSLTIRTMQYFIATVVLMGCLVFFAQYFLMTSKSEIETAEQLLKSGDEAQATVIFNKILLANANDVRAYLGRAKAHRNQPEEAMKDYQRVLQLSPNNTEALLGAAEYHLKREKYLDAIAKADTVLDTQPDNMEANKILGLSYLGQGDCKKAIEPLKKVVEALSTAQDWPDKEKLRFALAKAMHAEGQCDEALQYLTLAITTDGTDGNLFFYRGKLEFDKENYDKAISDFEKAIRKGPRIAESHYYRGVCYAEKKDLKAAIDDWTKAIDGGYLNWEVFAKRGNAYLATGKYGDAVADLDDAIERNEKNQELKKRRALAYAELRKQTGSGAGTTADSPKMPTGNAVQVGYAELQAGHISRATEILTQAVKNNPNDADARRLLSNALVRSGNLFEGDRQLLIWANMQAGTPNAKFKLGKHLVESGQHRDAAVILEDCLRQSPNDTDVRVQLIRAYTLAGNISEARHQCDEGIATASSPANQELYRSLMPK